MRFSCEGCSAKYMISDDKVGPGGVKVRCKKCGQVTHVRHPEPVMPSAPAPAPAPSGIEWWVALDEQPVGPVGQDVIQRHWDQGEIGPESLVWHSGLDEWALIASLPELHTRLVAAQPMLPAEAPLAATEPVPAAPPPPEPTHGTDPVGVKPLPMAGLERTVERRLPGAPARKAQFATRQPPARGNRTLVVILVAVLVIVGVAAAGLWWMKR